MSITVYFHPTAMTKEQYDEVIRLLEEAGEGNPSGRIFHTCFASSEQLGVVDVWESAEQFDEFGKTLMPILEKVGVPIVEPHIMETHNYIT